MPHLIKTGFIIAPSNPEEYFCGRPLIEIKVPVVVNVEPKWAAEYLEIEVHGQNRVSILDLTREVESGTVKFNVTGTSATPSNKPGGDTTLLARIGPDELDEVNVIVLVPDSVSGNDVDGTVTGINQAADRCTSPAYFAPLAPGAVHLWTIYGHVTTLIVGDQFGNVLLSLYDGAEVTEGAAERPINQQVHGGGFYQDPVGVFADRPVKANFQSDSPTALGWPTASLVPMVDFVDPQNISVQVGGHQLSNNIKRTVTATASTSNVKVEWV